ncbi:hypothetical protein M0802_012948 [Mischocyttarus mexicanus]|nr:hypothetical protein M0802_012948 [Mischocyttarus mexicanus]
MLNVKTKSGFCFKPRIVVEYNKETSIDLSDQMIFLKNPKLEIETVENYNLKSSESTHVGSNDLEYVSQDAGIICNKHIVQKQNSFIKVFKDNKRKRTITPPAETRNAAQKKIKGNSSNNITLQNRYAVLAAENDKIEVDDSNNSDSLEEHTENAKIATKAKVPPPLIMHGEIQSHQRFQVLLKQNLKNKFFIKYKKERVELHTSTLEDFNHIKEKWTRDNIKFHTYPTKGEKRKTYVIYGKHHGITDEDIKLELEDLNIVVYNVNAMKGTSRPMFMVTTSAATNLAQLQDKVPDINNIQTFPWRKQATHQPADNPWTKAKDLLNKHNIQRNEGQSNPKNFFSTSNSDINNANTVNFRPSNVSNSLDNSSNNQNITSTDGMANLTELVHEIQEINKICNISDEDATVKSKKAAGERLARSLSCVGVLIMVCTYSLMSMVYWVGPARMERLGCRSN